MRARFAFAILATGLATAPPAAGRPVAEILLAHELHDLEGRPVDLASLEGHTVVLNFWAEWCAPCRRELPVFDAWNAQWEDRGVRFVAVSIDREARRARRMAEEMGLSLPLYHDGPEGLAATLDLPALPTTYLIDADGETVHVSRGSSDEALEGLRRAIEAQLSARPPSVSATRPGEER